MNNRKPVFYTFLGLSAILLILFLVSWVFTWTQSTGLLLTLFFISLALEMGKIAKVGLAPEIFGQMMNVTGSSLTNIWRRKPLRDDESGNNSPDVSQKEFTI